MEASRLEAPGPDHADFLAATLPHLDAVHRLARHLTSDPQGAEDLVQETYLRAYRAFSSHTGPSTRAWLTTICWNLARSRWRRQGRRPRDQALEGDGHQAAMAVPAGAVDGDVAAAVEARLERATLLEALRELPEEQRVAIVLMDLCGHTAAEVGELLGCPRGTVLARAHRGRRRLAALLIERGIDRGVR